MQPLGPIQCRQKLELLLPPPAMGLGSLYCLVGGNIVVVASATHSGNLRPQNLSNYANPRSGIRTAMNIFDCMSVSPCMVI
jgi:hypothetical protein